MLQDNSDADPILFIHWFSSYDDERERSECVIDSLKKSLIRDERSIAYKVNILPPETKARPYSLSLTLQSKNKKESVEVDMLPVYDVLGKESPSLWLRHWINRGDTCQMISYGGI